jgi:hypothetical protein
VPGVCVRIELRCLCNRPDLPERALTTPEICTMRLVGAEYSNNLGAHCDSAKPKETLSLGLAFLQTLLQRTLKDKLTVSPIDRHDVFGAKLTLQDQLGNRVFKILLNRAFERPSTKHWVKAVSGQFS